MKTLLGGIMLAVGILIMTGSGLCSVLVLAGGMGGGADLSGLAFVLVIGGVPFVAGLGLFFAGRALIRSGRQSRIDPDDLRDRFG